MSQGPKSHRPLDDISTVCMEEEDKSAPEAAAVTTPENPPYTEAQSEKQEDSKEV